MFKRLFEAVTGTPWTTTRCVTTEFGPTPGARYRHIVTGIPDEVLMGFEPADLHALLADVEAQRQRQTKYQAGHVGSYLARSGS